MSRDAVRQAAARRTGGPRPRRVEMPATMDEQKRAVLLCRETVAEQSRRLHVRGCGREKEDGACRHLTASADTKRWRRKTYRVGRSGPVAGGGSRAEADGDALSGRIRQDVMKKTKGGRCT